MTLPGERLTSLRVLVVDDEEAARLRLASLLDELRVAAATFAVNGLEALEALASRSFDVLLLDIEMPEVSGLDVARRLPAGGPLVVFHTAYDAYALQAIEREAVDYLLKPVSRERLAAALERAARRLEERERAAISPAAIERLSAAMPSPPPRRLLVRYQAGHRLLDVAEIARFAARDGLVYAVTSGPTYATDDTLDGLEAKLAATFVRTSRADLIAVDRIDRLVASGDGSAALTLRDGTALRVSRRRAAGVHQALRR